MWHIVDHDDVEHKIVYAKRRGVGDGLSVEIKAVPLFFDTLDTNRIYERYDEHMTASVAFGRVFDDLPFSFVINGQFDAVEWEGFGDGESKLETFKRCLERYEAEFRIVGSTVFIEHLIGRDTVHQYRHRLNASNIEQENDATSMWTYAKGYGDYEDSGEDGDGGGWETAKLTREYTSPIANVIGIRHAPPIKDGRIKYTSVLDEQLKTLVNESLRISVTADIHDLRRQGYPIAQSQVGDRVFIVDERIGLDEEVRVVEMSLTRNWRGEVVDYSLTFGSYGITKRYESKISSAVNSINDILSGKKKIPFSALDEAVQRATRDLKSAQTELIFDNGIIAQEKNDPNKLVLFNSGGIGISDDGGQSFRTAMTGSGIVADVITTGTMLADRIAGGILSSLNGNTVFNLNTGRLDMENVNFNLGGGAKILFTDPRNNLTYTYGGRTSGIGFGNSIGEKAITFIGHTRASDPFTARDESNFRGFVTNAATSSGDVVNTVSGPYFRVRNNIGDHQAGFEFHTTSTVATLRPLSNDMTSNIGSSTHRINNIRADNIYGTLAGTSTHNAKMNIEDIDAEKAFDYFDMMKIKSFYYTDDDYTNPFNRRVSPIIEQLDPVLENLYKVNADALDINSNLFLLVQAFKYYVEKTDARLEALENGGN